MTKKTYEFKVNTPSQNWTGSTDMNGNTNIRMSAELNCTEKQEEAFHGWLKATKRLHNVCNGIDKLECE